MFFLSNKIACNDSSSETRSLMLVLQVVLCRQGRVVQEKHGEAGLPGRSWHETVATDAQEPAQMAGERWAWVSIRGEM